MLNNPFDTVKGVMYYQILSWIPQVKRTLSFFFFWIVNYLYQDKQAVLTNSKPFNQIKFENLLTVNHVIHIMLLQRI